MRNADFGLKEAEETWISYYNPQSEIRIPQSKNPHSAFERVILTVFAPKVICCSEAAKSERLTERFVIK
jgi:hypothetical protein